PPAVDRGPDHLHGRRERQGGGRPPNGADLRHPDLDHPPRLRRRSVLRHHLRGDGGGGAGMTAGTPGGRAAHPSQPTDTELVRRFLEGREEAFVELMSRHERKIYNLAYRMLGGAEDARDATQETFLSCF